jgi:hypothetical protein
MERPMPAEDQKDNEKRLSIVDQFVWTIKRVQILFRYWLMPPNGPKIEASRDERVSATIFALLLIFWLTFAIRGTSPNGKDYFSDSNYFATLAGAFSVALSVILNVLSKSFHIDVRENTIISAYTSTIWVMLLFIFVQMLPMGSSWFITLQQYVGEENASTFVSAGGAVILTFVCFVLKSTFVDRHKITALSLRHGLVITVFSGVIVVFISVISTQFFNEVIGVLKK